jgi:hypothetical protein
LNIDQLLSKRKLDEDKDESTVHQGSLAPPPKYSVAHVKEATASPSSQDSFMKEVKKFHKKHILRKVSDEEKGPTKTLLTETTTLLFTPDEVSFTKEESQSNENTGEPGKRALVKKAPEKPKKKLRKHTASKKKTRNAWKKIARIATMFHRKQQVVRDDRGLDLEENEEEEDTSTHDEAHSLASEKKSVRSGKSALSKGSQISKKSSRSQRSRASMNPTPQSLVEQRKSQLEGFFAAYSQKVVRDKPAQDPAAAMPSEVLGQQQLPLTHAATTNSQSTMQSSHGSSSETPKIVNSFSLKSEASGSNPAADPETNCNSTRSSSSSKKENAPQTMRSNIENSMRRGRQFSSPTHLEDEMEEDTFASSIQFTKPKEIAIVKKEMKPPKNELLATISQRSSEKKKKSANQRKRDKRVKQAALFGTSQQVPLSERERQRKERKARLSTTLW